MKFPPALSRLETLRLIAELRAATSEPETQRLERLLMEGNLRFCAYHARHYQRPGLDLEDLVAVASAALLDAVRRFDPAKSTHFAAYARRCIRRDLAVMVRRQGSSIRLPREARRGEAQNGRRTAEAPTVVALPIDHTGHDPALVVESPEAAIVASVDAERMVAAVDALPEREATVVRLRFGLAGIAPHELAEIGAIIGVSKQRVEAILKQALATLRRSVEPTLKAGA
jgi:RNA polymerase sigma factor (sigma-70 family)